MNTCMPLMLTPKSPFNSAVNWQLGSGQLDPSELDTTFHLKDGMDVAAESCTVCFKI